MSCDEVAMIHENLGSVINRYFLNLKHLRYKSVVFFGPIAILVIGVFVLKMKKYLNGSTKAKRFLIAGVFIYLFGSIILENTINFINPDSLLMKIEPIFEESFEMIGITVIIKGLMEHYKFLTVEKRVRNESLDSM